VQPEDAGIAANLLHQAGLAAVSGRSHEVIHGCPSVIVARWSGSLDFESRTPFHRWRRRTAGRSIGLRRICILNGFYSDPEAMSRSLQNMAYVSVRNVFKLCKYRIFSYFHCSELIISRPLSVSAACYLREGT